MGQLFLTMNKKDASKKLCWLLRHAPALAKEIDPAGFVSIGKLIEISGITKEQIQSIVKEDKKNRYEIMGDVIRACYGHNAKINIVKIPAKPSEKLYHGTATEFLGSIFEHGLRAGQRRHVHLSSSLDAAQAAGKRKSKKPLVLTIDSEKAFKDGINFYEEEGFVWLTDSIPPNYIIKITSF